MRLRPARVYVVLGMLAGVGAAAVACGTFGSSSDPASNADDAGDAGSDGATSTDADLGDDVAPHADAIAPDAEGTTSPACPPPAAPSCALGACNLRTLYVPEAPSHPFAIATDSAYVYWLEQRDPDPSLGYNGKASTRVLRVDRAGSTTFTTATELAKNQPATIAMALVPPYLYWATWSGSTTSVVRTKAACTPPCQQDNVSTFPGRVLKLIAIGSTAVFALGEDGQVMRIPADAAAALPVVVTTTGSYPGMAATTTHVYATSRIVGSVARADVSGTAVAPAWAPLSFDAGTENGLGTVATDCTDLFGVHGLTREVMRVKLSTGALSRLMIIDRHVYDMAADAKYLYLGSLDGGGVVALDKVTGAITPLTNANAFSIAVDSAGVYWGEHPTPGGGKLVMLVK